MIRLAICDADMIARKETRLLCERYFRQKGLECQIEQYGAGEELLVEAHPDILLLDVRLKRINGILVKEILETLNADTRILFIAENRNYMADAFGKNVYGYLIKPLKVENYFEKMDAIVADIKLQEQYVFAKRDEKIEKVFFKNIIYVEVRGRKTGIYVRKTGMEIVQYITDLSLSKWEKLLPKEQFIRTSRSQIVNLMYVVDIKRAIELINGIKIPIGEIYRERFLRKYDDIKQARGLHRKPSRTSESTSKIY